MSRQHALDILIIDDDPAEAELVKEAFRELGSRHHVRWGGDGQEALQRLRKGPQPDLVLLDINMPGMDGHETLSALRADPDLWHLHVVVLTMSTADADMDDAFKAHADAFIVKPAGLVAFRAMVDQVDRLAETILATA